MTTQHTPGPWISQSRDGEIQVYSPTAKIIVADCAPCCGDRVRRGGKCKANAQLIAAAPELMAALQACVEALQEVPCMSNKQVASEVNAQAAIAKATQQ